MKDIHVKINKNGTVDFENGYAGLNKENLQGNIYFEFEEFVEGQARAEIVVNNQSGYILLDQTNQTYYLPIKSSLLTGDDILMQLVIDQEATYHKTTDTEIDNNKTYYIQVGDQYEVVEHPQKQDLGNYYEAEIPVWKSETFLFDVGYSINATTTIPDDYPGWVETINELIIQTNDAITQAENVNIESEQLTDGVKVITTNKNGQQTITIVPQGPQGEPGAPGAVKVIVVDELPTTDIETDAIYLVPSSTPGSQNTYDEYMYIYNQWEKLGGNLVIDLTNYVQFTDYPGYSKGGVIKISPTDYALGVYNGYLYPITQTYAQYQAKANDSVVSKGTLENVITGKGLITRSDFGSGSQAGTVKANTDYGTAINSNLGELYAQTKTYAQYESLSNFLFISKGTLDNVLTEKIGNIQTLLDNLDSGSGV